MAVKKLPGGSNPDRQRTMNAQRTAATNNAKSGETAKRLASLRDETKNAKPRVIKINTNPVRTIAGVTSGSKTVNKLYRPMGGGGFWGNKQR
jgi:hypothetical protein